MADSKQKPTCFIAMPITTQPEHVERYGDDEDHWGHVMGSLFEKSIEEAGFRPIRPAAQGSHLIHAQIIRHLSTANLVLVDLSTHNPNVFFELGVRTSLDLPIALVRDEHTDIPFDTSGINTYAYDSNLRGWELEEQRDALMQHITDSYASCAGKNPLWQQFGLKIRASEPDSDESPRDAKLDLIVGQLGHLQRQMENDRGALQAVPQGRLEDAGSTWSYQADKSRRGNPSDRVAEELSKTLRHSDGRSYAIQTIGPNLLEIGTDGLEESTLSEIRELGRNSGVQVIVRPLSEIVFHDQRRKNSRAPVERRKRELPGVSPEGH